MGRPLLLVVGGGLLLSGLAFDPVARADRSVAAADTSVTRTGNAPPPDTTALSPGDPAGGLPLTYGAQLRALRTLERRPDATEALELGGLVVDETITPRGRAFYSAFFGAWQPPAVSGFYTIRVKEEPTPGRGSLVQVFVNDDATFGARLQPQTAVDDLALQAARRTHAYVRGGHGLLDIR